MVAYRVTYQVIQVDPLLPYAGPFEGLLAHPGGVVLKWSAISEVVLECSNPFPNNKASPLLHIGTILGGFGIEGLGGFSIRGKGVLAKRLGMSIPSGEGFVQLFVSAGCPQSCKARPAEAGCSDGLTCSAADRRSPHDGKKQLRRKVSRSLDMGPSNTLPGKPV